MVEGSNMCGTMQVIRAIRAELLSLLKLTYDATDALDMYFSPNDSTWENNWNQTIIVRHFRAW
jgi:hypothetical protein